MEKSAAPWLKGESALFFSNGERERVLFFFFLTERDPRWFKREKIPEKITVFRGLYFSKGQGKP